MKKTKIGAVVLSLLILSGCQKPMVSSGTSEVSSLPESTETSSSTAVSSSTALSSKAVSSSVSSSVETLYGITAFHNMTTAKVILSGIAVGDHFKAGTSLTAVFTFDAFLSGTKAYVNATAMALFQNTEKPDEYSFTFTMPKEDVVLTLFIPFTPSEDGSIYTIVLKDTHASVWGIENGEKYNCPSFKVFHDEGYLVHVSAYLTDTPFPVTVDFNTENNQFTVDAHDASNQLLRDPITVYVSTQDIGVKSITYVGTENLKEGAVLPSSATPGDVVEVKCEVKDEIFFDKVTFSVSSLKEQNAPSFRFVMPNEDLTITFNFNDCGDVVIPAAEHLTGYHLYSDSALTQETQGYHPGEDLYVHFSTEDEYKVYALAEDSGRNAVSSISDNVYKVAVANDFWNTLTLTPSVSTHHSVTFQTVAHVTFALLEAADASVYPGKTVKFTAAPDSGYHLTSVTETNGKVQISEEGTENTYEFTSIAEDVEITASASDKVSTQVHISLLNVDYAEASYAFEYTNTTSAASGSTSLSSSTPLTIDCQTRDVIHCRLQFIAGRVGAITRTWSLSLSDGSSALTSVEGDYTVWDLTVTANLRVEIRIMMV